MKLFELDEFDEISKLIPKKSQQYWDFPSSLIAFGSSLKNSYLYVHPEGVLFRKRGTQMTLVTWNCSNEKLIEVLKDLPKSTVLKYFNTTKSLEGIPNKKDIIEYITYKGRDYQYILKNTKAKKRNQLSKPWAQGEDLLHIELLEPTHENHKAVLILFEEWAKWAKTRHFMVFRGHYLSYINRYFVKPNNVSIYGFYHGSKLVAIVGFEYFNEAYQITLLKHIYMEEIPALNMYVWLKFLDILHSLNKPFNEVYCGSTADVIKHRLLCDSILSYKIKPLDQWDN